MCPLGGKVFCLPASKRRMESAGREVVVSASEATVGARLWRRASGCGDGECGGEGGR